jgi:predicted metal-dependent phosphoesterase TrpH
MIDLHIHTNASSDGQHSPREIFEMARQKGLRALAFADHNSVDNVEEGFLLAAEFGMEFLSCMELNTFCRGLDLHLLAYFIDHRNSELQSWLAEIHRRKVDQAKARTAKLNELGFIFTDEDLQTYSDGRIPTGMSYLKAILNRKENRGDKRLYPYVAGHKCKSPYVHFYRDYLRGGKPAFVPLEDVSTVAAIQKIKETGGIPVLAHPSDTAEEHLLHLIGNGLEGLEVYTPYHRPREEAVFRTFAELHGLLVTAGSDFHGKEVKPDVDLGQVSGDHDDLLLKLKKGRKNKI